MGGVGTRNERKNGAVLKSLALVLVLAALGDQLAGALHAPVPGAAIGMTVLIAWFALRGGPDESSGRLFDGMAPHLPLFFVPAAVGIITGAELLSQAWAYIAAAIALGTAATIAATGLVAQALLRAPRDRRAT